MQNELKVIENDLVPVYETSTGEKVVYGSELHKVLGAPSVYREWIKRRISDIGAIDEEDYQGVEISTPSGQTKKEHIIKLDTAKEMAMLERSEKGKQVRRYFIEVEKKYKKTLPTNYLEALKDLVAKEEENQKLLADNSTLHREISVKNQIIGELKPKADYTDLILKSRATVTITQIAKDYGMSGQQMNKVLHDLGVQYKESGQWLLYRQYQDKGYTHSETVDIILSNGRPDVKMNTKWTQKGRLFLYELLKQNDYLPMIERSIAS